MFDDEELQEVSKPNEDKIVMAQTAVLQVFSQSTGPSSYTVLSSRMPRDAVTGPLFIYISQTEVGQRERTNGPLTEEGVNHEHKTAGEENRNRGNRRL